MMTVSSRGRWGRAVEVSEKDAQSEHPGDAPEDRSDETGAEGGSDSPAADSLPGVPADDDSPAGDTDQHSDA